MLWVEAGAEKERLLAMEETPTTDGDIFAAISGTAGMSASATIERGSPSAGDALSSITTDTKKAIAADKSAVVTVPNNFFKINASFLVA